MGRVLIVDLDSGAHKTEVIPKQIMEDFLGGRGLGCYLLYENLPAGTDPLSPGNVLVFSAGPIQGTNFYYGPKTVVSTRSPYTGAYLFSVASGSFGHQLKRAGYDSLILLGRAGQPSFLVVEDQRVTVRSAAKMVGMTTAEAHGALLEDAGLTGSGACVCIGPAGEQLHKMAVIATEGEKVRTFGRGGCGAVMGSKNLKGVVVAGSQKIDVVDVDAFAQAKDDVREALNKNPKYVEERRLYGSGADMMSMNERGILPTRNWFSGTFERAKDIALTEIRDLWPRKAVSCGPYCASPCSHSCRIERGPWQGDVTEGPEYETIYVFGSDCGVNQFDAIVAAEYICDQQGIDTMSCGATIAFAMECYEKGLITREDTGGIDLRFGNAEAMVNMTDMVARRQGFGRLLSEGSRKAAESIPGSERFAMQSKGLELGGYECRGSWGQALEFAVNSRGGCHHAYGLPARSPLEREHGTEVAGKGELVRKLAIERILFDCAIVCSFPRRVIAVPILVRAINAATGRHYTEEEVQRIGMRVITLERMFNVRQGFRRGDDSLPMRLLEEPLPDGPRKGSRVPLDALLDEGYQALGWDLASGIPLEGTLATFGLSEICSK